MTASKTAWGVLGTGRIAARFAADLARSRTGQLSAVGSRDIDSATEFAATHGVSRAYGSYSELLADDDIEVVYIATPHTLHTQLAILAAEAGKHVLSEKPLTADHATSMAVIDAAQRNDVFLMEGYMYRCHPQTAALVTLIRDGAIGAVRHIAASFAFVAGAQRSGRLFDPELGGGGILDVGGYPVSMARLIAGVAVGADFAEPVEIAGAGHCGPTGVDEWATATLRFASGITASLDTGVRLRAENVLRVSGSEGFLVVESPWTPGADEPTRIMVHRVDTEPREVLIDPVPLFAAEADEVAERISERQSPAMSWADTLGNMRVLDEWRRLVGVAERDNYPTVHGRPLRRRDDHSMRYGELPGIDKPISRLVMGVDNQRALSHASVMFDDFVERGGNCFDTAHHYGRGALERVLGTWMSNRGNRDDLVVIGKGAHTPHCDPESVTTQLMASLERLQTDHVDVYFLHRDNLQVPVGEFVDVLDEHRRAGRIGVYGGSNWTIDRFEDANRYARENGKHEFTALSNHLSLARSLDVYWEGCVHVSDPASRAWLELNNIPLFPWSSQARGFFAGRASEEDTSDPDLVRCFYSPDNFRRLARVEELATKLDVPTIAVALAFLLHQKFPVFPLIGPRTLEETRTSMAALDITLTDEEVRWLDLSDQ